MKLHYRTGLLCLIVVVAAASAATGRAHGASSALTAGAHIRAPTIETLADGSYACTAAHADLLDGQRQRIAEAHTLADARRIAIGPVHVASRALAVASLLSPGSDSLADARGRLESFYAQVEASASPADVAARFSELVELNAMTAGEPIQLADLQVGNADVHGPGGCNYTTGEIVAIVIGFILFIIPGIILLIVLC